MKGDGFLLTLQPSFLKINHQKHHFLRRFMMSKSRILSMLECIETHIQCLGYFIHDDTHQAAVASIELEAKELCEALCVMEESLVDRLATDVDLMHWHDVISKYSVSLGNRATPENLRSIFNDMAETLARIDEEVSYPSDAFLKSIYAMLLKMYDKKPKRELLKKYNKWKAQHSRRLLVKNLKDRLSVEKQNLMKALGEESFNEVFDADTDEIDIDGVARYILSGKGKTHSASIFEGLDFGSEECYQLFCFIIIYEHLKADIVSEEQQKKHLKKKTQTEEVTYKYPRSMSLLPPDLQGKINIVDDSRFALFADLLNQKVLAYIRQHDNKQLWDVLKSFLQLNGLLPKRFSRLKFAQLISFLCPDAGDSKKLQYCMEKNSLTIHEMELASRPFSDMLKPLF